MKTTRYHNRQEKQENNETELGYLVCRKGILEHHHQSSHCERQDNLGAGSLHLLLHPLAPALLSHARLEVRCLANVLAELLAHLGPVHIDCEHRQCPPIRRPGEQGRVGRDLRAF